MGSAITTENNRAVITTMIIQLIHGCLCALCLTAAVAKAHEEPATDIGPRRQLLVDRYLIETMDGVRHVLHHPVRREVAIAAEHPWERFGVSYLVTFRDGDRFRAWYRCDAADLAGGSRRAMAAYAESRDGIHWEKPDLGIILFDGSRENNLVWDGPGSNMAPFRDDNPACDPAARYKAVVRSGDLYALVSPDGLRWKLAQEEPILTDRPFDSHNIAFWDAVAQHYVLYVRGIRRDGELGVAMQRRFKGGVRWIRRATSRDFVNWSRLRPIETGDAPAEEFYTNAAIRYVRAPDFILMFPSRFASARQPQPDWPFGKGVNDIVLLSSRDGIHFDRAFLEAFVRPGADEGNWHERSLYMERGILQTSPTQLSMYAMQNWRLPTVHIRRLTLRTDGFASIQAGYEPGEFVTRPILVASGQLHVNYSTSAVGSLRVEVQDASGNPLPGWELSQCRPMYGDAMDATVRWNNDARLTRTEPIRLRFELRDADVYAFRFAESEE